MNLKIESKRGVLQDLQTAYLSFVTPSTKQIMQGSTFMASFSTSHGTFSTNTRENRVEKYLGANSCRVVVWAKSNVRSLVELVNGLASRCLSMILQRWKFRW